MPFLLHEAYLVHIDGQSNEDVEEVSERQASDEDVRPIPHALVLVNDPEERGVADDAHYEDGAGHDGVDVLEDVPDIRGLHAHRQQGRLGAAAPGEALGAVRQLGVLQQAWLEQAVRLLLAEHLEGDRALLESPRGLATCPGEEAGQENGESGGRWDAHHGGLSGKADRGSPWDAHGASLLGSGSVGGGRDKGRNGLEEKGAW